VRGSTISRSPSSSRRLARSCSNPVSLLARLEHRLPLLAGGPRDAPERQRTLRAAIEWSYDLLDDEAKPLFTRLAVFAGSFSLEAAEEVGEANLDALLRLADSSLLRSVGDGRLLMLETIREYGLERLEEAGEGPQTSDRHAEYFARLADGRWLELIRGDSPDWNFSTIQLEFRNLHVAIERSLERGRTEDVLAIGSGIYPWWDPSVTPIRGGFGSSRRSSGRRTLGPAVGTPSRPSATWRSQRVISMLRSKPTKSPLQSSATSTSRSGSPPT
jgi:predicted ATPase